MLEEFFIDEKHLVSEPVTFIDHIADRNNPTDDDLIKILKGNDTTRIISTRDPEEFSKLRLKLEELGYIKCQRSWTNGDVVIKPFKLNGWMFKKGKQFPCAIALGIKISCAVQNGQKELFLL